MKLFNIIFFFFTLTSISFCQTERANEFILPTGVLTLPGSQVYVKTRILVGSKYVTAYTLPSITDTRDSLDLVNDSLRIRVYNKTLNTLLTTYFLNDVKNIATSIYYISSINDTTSFKPIAISNCPTLSVAKLDSGSVSSLFLFDCANSSWVQIKAQILKVSSKIIYVDSIIGSASVAEKGFDVYQFNSYTLASNSSLYKNGDLLKINPGFYPNLTNTQRFVAADITQVRIYLENGVTLSHGNTTVGGSLIGTSSSGLNVAKETLICISGDGIILNNAFTSAGYSINNYNQLSKVDLTLNTWKGTNLGGIARVSSMWNNYKIGTVEFGSSQIALCFLNTQNNSYNNFSFGNVFTTSTNTSTLFTVFDINNLGGASEPGSTQNNNIWNIEIANYKSLRRFSNVLSSNHGWFDISNNKFNLKIGNIYQTASTGFSYAPNGGLNFNNNHSAILHIKGNGSTPISKYIDCNFNLEIGNSQTDIPLLSIPNVGTSFYTYLLNSTISLTSKNAKVTALPSVVLASIILDNSTITINCENMENLAGVCLIDIANCSLTNNSKIIIKGKYKGMKGIYIVNNTIDATSKIIFDGQVTSTTEAGIIINTNNGTSDKILIGGIINGVTNSIALLSGSANTSVTIKPGTVSSVPTVVGITQLGTGLYVDPRFND